MPIPLLMPALSPTMTEGNIAKWLKKKGDIIKSGDIIAEVETDKATMEIEAIDDGKLAEIIHGDGSENVLVNDLIGIISTADDKESDVEEFKKGFKLKTTEKNLDIKEDDNIDIKEDEKDNNEVTKETEKNNKINIIKEENNSKKEFNELDHNNNKIIASPLAKRIAKEKNINLADIIGSGPKGRIIKRDVIDTVIKPNKDISDNIKPSFEIKKLTNIRKTIANKLQNSKQTIPHFYLKTKINVDKLYLERRNINSFLEKDTSESIKISFNDIFIKALAASLKAVPDMNATWNEDSIKCFKNVDISVAVATPSGLFTPVIKNAEVKSLSDISKEMKVFIDKAKKGKLMPEDYIGGAFSISNLGMYNIDEFSAIINPPQSGILAVGKIFEEPRVIEGNISMCKYLNAVLSVDHRIADGSVGAELLKYFEYYLNNPMGMLV
tara:strand:+ start:852 stop:2168 length:1317 start_codon:yes stop_codon:yes gene_type:complete